MFLYVVIFQQMKCFFAAKTSPNMIGLTVKNIIIKKQLKKKSVSMRIGWFTDVPPAAILKR